MARLPILQANQNISRGGGFRVPNLVGLVPSVQDDLTSIAASSVKVGKVLRRQKQTKDLTSSFDIEREFKEKLNQSAIDANADDPTNQTQAIATAVDTNLAELDQRISDENLDPDVALRLRGLMNTAYNGAIGGAMSLQDRAVKNNLAASLVTRADDALQASLGFSAAGDAKGMESVIRIYNQDLDAARQQGISAESIEKLRIKFEDRVRVDSAKQWIQSHPGGSVEAPIKAFGLNNEQAITVRAMGNSHNAAAKRSLTNEAKDMQEHVLLFGASPASENLKKRVDATFSGEDASRINAAIDISADANSSVERMKIASPGEMAAIVDENRPTTDTVRNTAIKTELVKDLTALQKNLMVQRDKDSFTSAIDANPLLERTEGQSVEDWVGSVVSFSEREWGITSPRVMGVKSAEREWARIEGMGTPEAIIAEVSSLKEQYGRFAPQMIRDMNNDGKGMPTYYNALDNLDFSVARNFLSAQTVKRTDYVQRLGTESAVKDVEASVSDIYNEIFKPTTPPNYKFEDELRRSIQNYALKLAETPGAGDAGEKAMEAILLDHYDIEGRLRVPKQNAGGVTGQDVALFLSMALSGQVDDFQPENIERGDFNKTEFFNQLSARGTAITNTDETGIRFYLDEAALINNVTAISPGTQPIEFTWEEIAEVITSERVRLSEELKREPEGLPVLDADFDDIDVEGI